MAIGGASEREESRFEVIRQLAAKDPSGLAHHAEALFQIRRIMAYPGLSDADRLTEVRNVLQAVSQIDFKPRNERTE